MTEEFKEKTIKYLTGNIEPETGINEPHFIDGGYVEGNISDYIRDYFEYQSEIMGRVVLENSEYFLTYGYYYTSQELTNILGFILIVDNNNQPVQMLTEFDSGTNFRAFKRLDADEDGYIYGIDMEWGENIGSGGTAGFGNYRFVMLNKILLSNALSGDFYAKLRRSYFFPSNILSSVANVFDITHQISTANYFIFCQTTTNNNLGILSLSINVGQTNEWKITPTNLINSNKFVFFNDYRSENFKIIISGTITNSERIDNYREIVYEFSGNPTITLLTTINSPDFSTRDYYLVSMTRTNYQNTYLIYCKTTSTDSYYFYKVDYSNNTLEEIEKFTIPAGYDSAFFRKEGTLPFFMLYWRVEEAEAYIIKRYIGLIIEKSVYYLALDDIPFENFSLIFTINKNYNLYQIYTEANNNQSQKTQLIYNETNYNGTPYEAPNCLNPNSAVLYDDNDNIIFARNLYNKTLLGTTTTSTVQIPNTMLNDVTISENDLISETNLPLTKDTTDITKNIYETVNVNFVNSLSIRNDNDPENTILNPIGAARLNVSISSSIDYENAQATKVKINYVDGTSNIVALSNSQITMMSSQVAKYKFSVFVSKEIENMQIISHDEMTVYQTITGLNLTIGKIYNIVQYVSINRPIIFNDVLYNGENILYNGEQVTYVN